MQFEWAVKHVPPRNAGGLVNRIKKLYTTLNKPQWTSNAPPAIEVPLHVEWLVPHPTNELPPYVTETFNPEAHEQPSSTVQEP